MRGHFRYLRFKTFPMTPRTPQCEVFCPLLLSSKHSGVPEDSQPTTFPSVGLHPHTRPKWGCDTHCPPPCGGIAFQIGLSKLHDRVPSNLGGMQIILHFCKPSIHNLRLREPSKFPGCAGWNLASLDAPPLRVATNSLKSGLFILRRTSNCSWVNTTELRCSSSLLGSSWSSRVIGSSSPIDSRGTTRSSLGSSNMVSWDWACFRFFLGAIRNPKRLPKLNRSSDTK
jgi:hypothetical protein